MNNSNKQLAERLLKLKNFRVALERRLAKNDIAFFADTYLHHLLTCRTPDFHREIYGLLKTKSRLAIAAPRSFAKSTVVDIIFVLHCLLFNKKEDIIIVSNSGDLAIEWVRRVKHELDNNEKIMEAFGRQRFDGRGLEIKWKESHIILNNGNQIRGKGKGAQIRGFRPTRVILDDLEDDEGVRSKDQRDKLKEWFLGALINTLEPNQQLIYIGTLLHPLSLLKQIVTEDDSLFVDWEKRLYRAIIRGPSGNDESIWPEKWSIDELRKRRDEIGTHKFESEYMNNPLADSTVVFHPDCYRYYDEVPVGDVIDRIISGFDLVGSAKDFEGKAYVAFITLGKTTEGRIYTLDARRGHWTQEEIVEHFISINSKFKPEAFVGEEINFQQIVHDYLLKETRKRGLYIPIQGIKLGSYTEKEGNTKKARDKVSRAITVQYIFTQGLFYFRKDQKEFIEEMSTFPSGDYSDQVDAAVHALHVLTDKVKIEISRPNARTIGETPLSTTLPPDRFSQSGIILEDSGRRF